MKDINKIIDSLSLREQNVMYNALQKKINRGPEYTISCDESGYYVKCDSPQLNTFRFEKRNIAYQNNLNHIECLNINEIINT